MFGCIAQLAKYFKVSGGFGDNLSIAQLLGALSGAYAGGFFLYRVMTKQKSQDHPTETASAAVQKPEKLDEKWIEQIETTLKSKSTPELQEILANHDRTQYSAEAFEAMKRILSSRDRSMLEDIQKTLTDDEDLESIIKIKQKEEMKNYIKESLEEARAQSEELKSLVTSLNNRRKILFIIGIIILLIFLVSALWEKNLEMLLGSVIIICIFFGIPIKLNYDKSEDLKFDIHNLDARINTISQQLNGDEKL
jgi:hypothetical protein